MSIFAINLVVLNGEKYIHLCLDSIKKQAYLHNQIEINILDNGSTDNTKKIIRERQKEFSDFSSFSLIESTVNMGVWPGQEELLKFTNGKYIVCLSVDVILDKDFLKNAVPIFEKDDQIGTIQPKIYKYNREDLQFTTYNLRKDIIDTCGFQISRSRRITNIGHGENDHGQYDNLGEVFAVEGAAPVFRKTALNSCAIKVQSHNRLRVEPLKEVADHDYFWYGDDLDLAWRMRLFGWKEIFAPNTIAWHDRQTTKNVKKHWWDYIFRVPIRHQIPIKKRRLDWRNTRFTIIKNDYIINILRDLPRILAREIMVFGYTLLFEPQIFLEFPKFLRLLPKIVRKREEVMKKAKVSPEEMHKWFK